MPHNSSFNDLPIIVIGAGPIGLAAAAQLLERGMEPLILEQGKDVAHAIRQWAHVRMFSPWSFNVDESAKILLKANGWNAPCGSGYPTGGELVSKYLEPLAALPAIKSRLRLGYRVIEVARANVGKIQNHERETYPFEVHTQNEDGEDEIFFARGIIDASGTWNQPNPAGSNGLFAQGEKKFAKQITYGMPDILGRQAARYKNKRVTVLGSGHSAIGTLLDLTKMKEDFPLTKIIWLVRKSQLDKVYGGGSKDKLLERGLLGQRLKAQVDAGNVSLETQFSLARIEGNNTGDLVIHSGDGRTIFTDELVVATGARPNLDILREIRLSLDPALECPTILGPMIDPNLHSCGTVRPHGALQLTHPEPNFFIAGMKSYGRAPTFLLATGYEQVRSIAAFLAGDMEAAERIELNLPETGVCNTNRSHENKKEVISEKTSLCCTA